MQHVFPVNPVLARKCVTALPLITSSSKPKVVDHPDSQFCPLCGKTGFASKYILARHIKAHDEASRTFVCSFPNCCKAFHQRGNLEIHERVHMKDKPFICGVCSDRFTSGSNLRHHERKHGRVMERRQDLPHVDLRRSLPRSASFSAKGRSLQGNAALQVAGRRPSCHPCVANEMPSELHQCQIPPLAHPMPSYPSSLSTIIDPLPGYFMSKHRGFSSFGSSESESSNVCEWLCHGQRA